MISCHTSLRARTVAETLAIAGRYADRLGISRVTDITRLDRIGLPVFAGIRPAAMAGSLCVSAGKGLLPAEARAGAYMEAIEMAFAEPRHSRLATCRAAYREVLDGPARPEAVLDLCPVAGVEIPLAEETDCVAMEDLISGRSLLVPAELIFIPYPRKTGQPAFFGNHSNGLASGNNREEACIHGILEVVERDILSFQYLRDTSRLVEPASWPPALRTIHEQVREAHLQLVLRHTENEYGLPFFSAVLIDPAFKDPMYINAGYGCHSLKEVAALRAVTEAAQSRLSFIHGGRDDLIDDYLLVAGMAADQRRKVFEQLARRATEAGATISFGDIPERTLVSDTTDGYLQELIRHLRGAGVSSILAAFHTAPEEPLQVVKVIIPTLEFFTKETRRIGPRLKNYAVSLR